MNLRAADVELVENRCPSEPHSERQAGKKNLEPSGWMEFAVEEIVLHTVVATIWSRCFEWSMRANRPTKFIVVSESALWAGYKSHR